MGPRLHRRVCAPGSPVAAKGRCFPVLGCPLCSKRVLVAQLVPIATCWVDRSAACGRVFLGLQARLWGGGRSLGSVRRALVLGGCLLSAALFVVCSSSCWTAEIPCFPHT